MSHGLSIAKGKAGGLIELWAFVRTLGVVLLGELERARTYFINSYAPIV